MTSIASIQPGILNLPGSTPQSKALVEKWLDEDRQQHHCLYGKVGFHNHLSHQSVGKPTSESVD